MKKNVLLVITMALVVINIILTSVMMFTMMGTNKKTANLVNDIAAILKLEIVPEEDNKELDIPMSDQKVWNMTGNMTIPLKSEDGKNHYVVFDISLSMNIKSEGYKKYGETIADYESIVKDTITRAVSKYTVDDCAYDFETIREDILHSVRALFEDDEFIYRVGISGIVYQ